MSPVLTAAHARRVCDAAEAEARRLGIAVCICVVDAATDLLAFVRMDGATVPSIDGSQGKAVASALWKKPSQELEQAAARPVMQALLIRMHGRFVPHQGAVPIVLDETVVGAIGVGGALSVQDETCARAGADVLLTE